MFSHEVDYKKTIALVSHHYESQQAYMEQHLTPHNITFPHCPNNRWVPVELLKYIHNHDCPYIQHLEGYMRDDKDVKALKTLAHVEAELTTKWYPEGATS